MIRTSLTPELRQYVQQARQRGQRIGCVPTMGALHRGHGSLIERAREKTDFVVVTIFVNPTQFGPHEDFQKYPRPLQADLALCEGLGADLVFHPPVTEVYRVQPQVQVTVGELASRWEGAIRPGHFDGVATVVTKLFNIVQPDQAFFGAKDFQQQAIVRALCVDLNLPIDIVTCSTIRDADGLALSSRNVYLSSQERERALVLNRSLRQVSIALQNGATLSAVRSDWHELLGKAEGIVLDYAELVDPVTLLPLEQRQSELVAIIAARVGTTRLIDNLLIELS